MATTAQATPEAATGARGPGPSRRAARATPPARVWPGPAPGLPVRFLPGGGARRGVASGWAARLLPGCLLLAAATGAAAPAAAQLPAPPASARGPFRIGVYGTVGFGLGDRGADATATGTAGTGASGGAAVPPSTTPPATTPPSTTPGAGSAVPAGAGGLIESTAALLVSGTFFQRLSYFGEVDGARRSFQNWPGRRDDRSWEVDRLYAEVALGDWLRLRAGRFLTPIGRWNEIHADPLTWTTERPLTSYRPFAKSVTGVLAAGALALAGHDAGYAVFYAPVPTSPADPTETAFTRAAGGRVAVELLPGLYMGASAAGFRASWPYAADDDSAEAAGGDGGDGTASGADARRASAPRPGPDLAFATGTPGETEGPGDREVDGAVRRLFALDLSWNRGPLEVLAEASTLSAAGWRPAERGGFAQVAVALVGPLYAVARSELYTPVVRQTLHIQTLGLALRPTSHFTLKLDRQLTDRPSARAPDGWFVSASAMF